MLFKHGSVQTEPDVTAVIITQISLKSGLKKWVKKARGIVHLEMKQLYTRDTFILIHSNESTEEQRNTILESHLILKYKR